MQVVFLDRDGVINEKRPDHVKSWPEFVFLPGSLEALRRLHRAGWATIVVTNQAIIHRGTVSRARVDDIHARMARVVERHGGRIDAVLCCPHRPDEGCACRKPQPGLLLQAAAHFSLPLEQCYLVGDNATDILAGQAVGCRSVLVGSEHARRVEARLTPDHTARDLLDAVAWLQHCEAALLAVRQAGHDAQQDFDAALA